ncbi:MAG: sulfite exporter TauE/SafE family protein [Verrucomicrobia bacterium]|nr:sulfite exporter TauE/SafE family protein [Verrucomicrobiota bacterium]
MEPPERSARDIAGSFRQASLPMPELSTHAWLMAYLAAACAGLSKSGFGPFGLITILLMTEVAPARESTGLVLPLLLAADFLSVFFFHEHGSWKVLRSLLPATLAGIVAGWWIMPRIPADFFAHTLGWIILGKYYCRGLVEADGKGGMRLSKFGRQYLEMMMFTGSASSAR